MMSGLDRGEFGAVFFTGYHAWASSSGNPLSHTINGGNEYITINGVRASEFLINAYTAGYYGVPVAFLSGDRTLCDFAASLIPDIVTLAVNEGRGGSVITMHPAEAVDRIRCGAEEAVRRVRSRESERDRYIDMELERRLRREYREIAQENGGILIPTDRSEEECFSLIRQAVLEVMRRV